MYHFTKEGSTVVSGIFFQASDTHSKDVNMLAQAMTTISQLLLGQQWMHTNFRDVKVEKCASKKTNEIYIINYNKCKLTKYLSQKTKVVNLNTSIKKPHKIYEHNIHKWYIHSLLIIHSMNNELVKAEPLFLKET